MYNKIMAAQAGSNSLPFHPLINAWFTETYGKPTPVQNEAWPLISGGEHVLALAPTGSGKTLTGFLAAISRFADGTYEAEKLSVIYVSPLKALNEDIRRNLIMPLEGIRERFERAGELFPPIRVETRSGDTPQSERRRLLSMPPSILALTPESLAILLLNPRGRLILSSVRYVILDEIHSALGSKRGCFLSCQIDRLALVAGEFQRVALSATVKPPEAAADFAGGLVKRPGRKAGKPVYEKRKVHIVAPNANKELKFRVVFSSSDDNSENEDEDLDLRSVERYGERYTELIKFIVKRIRARSGNGTILVFSDSRRRVERINYILNKTAENIAEFAGKPLSYAHHGSLSTDVRREVEKALAAGEIPCVVATGSLELGIDIGGVEEVILAGSPGSSAVSLQRVGRSGHGVGETSFGWLMPFYGMDLLQAAAVSGAVEEKELEEITGIENPLDILAQIILALCAERDWNENELYETICGFYVYRTLSRASYDGVVRMLAGAYEGERLRELKRQIFRDDETGTLSAAPGTLPLLYTSGGVIVSRGSYSLRLAPDGKALGTKIGELDEEFVWERRIGDCFDFGNRSWRITAIGDEAMEVVPLASGADYVPFWHGEIIFRSPVLSRRILEILEGYYPKGWTSPKPEKMLDHFSPEARTALEEFLRSQWSVQEGLPLSGPSFIPVEIVDDPGRGDARLIVFHSFRGGGVNIPLSLALERDLELRYGMRVEGMADDNSIFVRLPRMIAGEPASIIQESLRRLSEGGKGEERFRERLESSGIFGAAFREAVERSLVIPRAPFGKRIPLWVIRQKAKRLFDAVKPYGDFPITAEAWRTCLKEQFDMEGFRALLDGMASLTLSLAFFRTKQPSPFCKGPLWAETNKLIYEYDERPDLKGAPGGPSLSDRVIAEALGSAGLRPALKAELVEDFCSRLRREIPGWAPDDVLTLCEWVKERVAIPSGGDIPDEWERLLDCIPDELKEALREDKSLNGRIEYRRCEGAKTGIVIHREWAKKLNDVKGIAGCLAQWLRYEGPLPLSRIQDVFDLSSVEAEEAADFLLEQESLVRDVVVEASSSAAVVFTGRNLLCDRENLELLLRMSRRKQRPVIKERPASLLVPFLARRQGLFFERVAQSAEMAAEAQADTYRQPWKHLAGIAASAKLWETEFFPCRFPSYSGEMFDRELQEGRLLWYGAGKEKAAFCQSEDLELVLPVSPQVSLKLPEAFFDSPRSFWEIRDALIHYTQSAGIGFDTKTAGVQVVARLLWEEVWRGSLSADSWEPLRKAMEGGFAHEEFDSLPGPSGGSRTYRIPRALRDRWRSGPPVRGNWFSLAGDLCGENLSPLEEEELNRERVRLLLDRWGLLARPLLEREASVLSWSKLLPAMRRMELAGELTAGRFFGGIDSLQFASPHIARELEEAEAAQGVYWMNACDPASPAGLAIHGVMRYAEYASAGEPRTEALIRRVASTRLCYRGAELVAVAGRGGRELDIFISPDDPDMSAVLAFVKHPRTRKIHCESKLSVEVINGRQAASGAFSPALAAVGFVKDRGKMVLW